MNPLAVATLATLALSTANNSGSNDFGTTLALEPLAYYVSNTGDTAASTLGLGLTLGLQMKLLENRCPATLAAGAKCVFLVGYFPDISPTTDTLSATTSSGAGDSATLTGANGTAGQMSFTGIQEFGVVAVGETRTQTYRLQNTTGEVRPILPAGVGTMLGSQFTITGDGCSGQTLAVDGSCSLDVAYSPTASGDTSEAIRINFSGAGPLGYAFTVNGTGGGPSLSVSGSGAFGSVALGQSSSRIFTVTNTGTTEARFFHASLLATGTDFSLFGNNCEMATLLPGASCNFEVVLNPSFVGTPTASMIFYSPNATLAELPLTATVVGASLDVAGTADFGTVSLPDSVTQTFTITNSGGGTAYGLTITLADSDGPFALGPTTCAIGGTLEAGASCSIDVIYAPQISGVTSNELRVGASHLSVVGTPLTGAAL